MDEHALEAIYAAIRKAEDTHYRDFGLYDYTRYDHPIPHVVRDHRVQNGSQTLFESVDADAARAFIEKHRAQYVARAAVAAYLHHSQQYVASVAVAAYLHHPQKEVERLKTEVERLRAELGDV